MTDAELDRLVPKKVMGWTPRFCYWIDGSGQEVARRTSRPGHPAWSPSTDIRAAFEVVEQMKGLHWSMRHSDVWPSVWRADIGGHFAYDKSLPRAICLAALRAKGVEG